MSKFFENPEENQYIPPDYDSPTEDDDDEEDDIEDVIETEDEGKIEQTIEELHKEETKNMVTTPFGSAPTGGNSTPWNTPSFGGGGTAPFGGNSGNNNSPWGNRTPSWGSGSPSPSIWNSGGAKIGEKESINREKKIIFCDFLDCIVETWDSQGRPGYLPRDIYDLKPRFEVWDKIQAFNPEQVYSMIPINLIPNTNGDFGWLKTLEYF